jgi:hypothetical protein
MTDASDPPIAALTKLADVVNQEACEGTAGTFFFQGRCEIVGAF